jgi:hypothetical protein
MTIAGVFLKLFRPDADDGLRAENKNTLKFEVDNKVYGDLGLAGTHPAVKHCSAGHDW